MNSETERSYYGIEEYKAPPFEHFETRQTALSLYQSIRVTDFEAFWRTVAPAFNDYVSLLNTKI